MTEVIVEQPQVHEYVSVVWHRLLTAEHTKKIENIQKSSLKIILGPDYIDYPTALEWCGLTERNNRCLAFAKGERMFPLNHHHDQDV